MAVTAPKEWSIQQIFTQTYKDVANTTVYGTLEELKTASIANDQQTVYSMGGVGNAYLTAHSHSKRVTGAATAATYKNSIMGLITGTDVVTGATVVPVNGEILTVTSDAATLEYTPVGTTNSELKGVFILNDDGTFGTEIEQAATTSAGKVVLTGKALAFFASELADDTQVIVFYEAATDATTQTISNNSGNFSKIVRIEMQTLVQDKCSGDEFEATLIVYKAKLTGSWNIEVASDGEPATLDVSFEALKASCTSSKFWDMIIVGSLV